MKVMMQSALLTCLVMSRAVSLAQTSTSPTIQVLQSAVTAMLGKVSVQDITLVGLGQVPGSSSTAQDNSFEFRATSAGLSRTDLDLPSGIVTNIWQLGGATPAGAWSIGSGAQQAMAPHNLLSGADWPFPPYLLLNVTENPSMVVSYIGAEGTLSHLSASEQQVGAPTQLNSALGPLTQIDIWLNSSTLLPAQITFNQHPDNNALVNIPVTVEFSNYQTMGQIVVPATIQEFINNTLALTLTIQSATVNSGLSSSIFMISTTAGVGQ